MVRLWSIAMQRINLGIALAKKPRLAQIAQSPNNLDWHKLPMHMILSLLRTKMA